MLYIINIDHKRVELSTIRSATAKIATIILSFPLCFPERSGKQMKLITLVHKVLVTDILSDPTLVEYSKRDFSQFACMTYETSHEKQSKDYCTICSGSNWWRQYC